MSETLEMLLPAVEEQLLSPETPYVKEAFDRLAREPDLGPQEAKRMIAFCLADEMERMVAENRPFDPARYQTLLGLLPALPE